MKYILVTGGVISGVGKGVIASSFGTLLKSCGLDVTSIKIDPYINIDAGTFSPYEHEVVLKAKWKGLRDNFRVEYKRIPRSDAGDFLVEPATFESKWIHYYALLFLTEHMRHRVPKNEQDQAFFFAQQSQDCEKTVVEPDLTNGLIRRMQDSDEEFDEDDVEEEDEEVTETTPPAAHYQPLTTMGTLPGAIIKTEDARNLLKNLDKEVQDLSKKSLDNSASQLLEAATTTTTSALELPTAIVQQQLQQQATTISSTTTGSGLCLVTNAAPTTSVTTVGVTGSSLSSSASSVSSTTSTNSSSCISSLNLFQTSPPIAHTTALAVAATLASMNNVSAAAAAAATAFNNSTLSTLPSAMVLPNTCIAAASAQQKIRSVSPPPLYNKAHHPPPHSTNGGVMSKERSDDFALNVSNCLHGSHEHLNFTKHSYTNGLIPALKLKRPRLSEDSNFNGSSTMDTSTPTSLVPEDDDYHYLLSLHPYMKQLTAAQKLRIRTKIQKLIFKELYKEDLEESK